MIWEQSKRFHQFLVKQIKSNKKYIMNYLENFLAVTKTKFISNFRIHTDWLSFLVEIDLFRVHPKKTGAMNLLSIRPTHLGLHPSQINRRNPVFGLLLDLLYAVVKPRNEIKANNYIGWKTLNHS